MVSSIQTNLSDPLNYLPYELWVECIHLAISDEPTGPLSLLEVSSNWTKKITAAPELWSRIHIDTGDDLLARAETFLCLSEPVRIDLVVEVSDELGLDLFKHITKKYASRIQSLFFGTKVSQSAIATAIDEMSVGSTAPLFPNVTHIETENHWTYWRWKLILACPRIQRFAPNVWSPDEIKSLPKAFGNPLIRHTIGSPERWQELDYSLYNLDGIHLPVSRFIITDPPRAPSPTRNS
ncbi:hypothetical protein M408DRAFT_22975 [Serendipita vermifera MAFF 305830]|uniref:F-box domain-containing protein n=1 Tax=Serendipita vermifera MAFF 305830 TaxID=933852 RepID=A0A0C3BAP5_SERVB|nr:hypothetical protein M408DRAFT_22975 [Serendipita vermifera MAFF 305830]